MTQYKNIDGKRYLKTVTGLTKAGAQKKAREYRVVVGIRVRVVPDGHGYYDLYTRTRKGK